MAVRKGDCHATVPLRSRKNGCWVVIEDSVLEVRQTDPDADCGRPRTEASVPWIERLVVHTGVPVVYWPSDASD